MPAFNEAGRIDETLAQLRLHLPTLVSDWEIRVVDDGSGDDTARIVEDAARADSRIVLQREPHRGKGGAVRAGMLAATGNLRFLCDADLSMPLRELSRFLALVPAHCDIAIGSREGADARRIGEPPHRHVLGRAFNYVVRAVALEGIHDTQCGFKLFTCDAANAVFPLTSIDGWAFDVEVLYIARRQGLEIRQVPIEWHYDGQSRVSALRDPLRMLQDVWRIRRNAARAIYDRRCR